LHPGLKAKPPLRGSLLHPGAQNNVALRGWLPDVSFSATDKAQFSPDLLQDSRLDEGFSVFGAVCVGFPQLRGLHV